MKYNVETLKIIEERAAAESRRYADAISVVNDLAANQAITWADAERINAASKPYLDRTNAAAAAAHRAVVIAVSVNRPQMPFLVAPAPLTAEEEAVLDRAYNDYIR